MRRLFSAAVVGVLVAGCCYLWYHETGPKTTTITYSSSQDASTKSEQGAHCWIVNINRIYVRLHASILMHKWCASINGKNLTEKWE